MVKSVLIFSKTEMPKVKRSTQKGGPSLSKSGENQVEMYKKEMDTKARNVLCTIIPGKGFENIEIHHFGRILWKFQIIGRVHGRQKSIHRTLIEEKLDYLCRILDQEMWQPEYSLK